MRKIKIIAVFALLLMGSFIFSGCPTRARKPTPSTPKPGKVSLETIDPTKAPAMVKDLIEKQKDRETFNVVRDGSSLYAVVTRGKVPFKNFDIKFKDVEKLDIGNGRTQVRIQVVFTVPDVFPGRNRLEKSRTNTERPRRLTPQQREQIKAKLGSKGEFFPVAVAKLSINTIPDTFSYNVLHEKDIPAETMDMMEGTSPTSGAEGPGTSTTPAQPAAANITVTTPPANATVTTPLTVSGKAMATTVTMQLKDDRGGVLATKTVSVAPVTAGQMGDFSTTLSFTPLSRPVNGTLDVFTRGSSGAKEGLVTIPVTIR